ncbi:uncharacterized protein LOC128655867 isoform X2 [Bombina bombina]|nr:uncharacterized protein LOC128655867 isoform X2 [Bombina bombina]
MPPALNEDTWQEPWPENYSYGLEGKPSQPRRVYAFTPPNNIRPLRDSTSRLSGCTPAGNGTISPSGHLHHLLQVQQAAAEEIEIEPAPRVPAGEEPMDPLTSAMGDEYIALQRRQTVTCESLTSTCERMQRDQRRFYRSQQTLQQRSIELQLDMIASLTAMVQNQSQMLRVISDMQIQSDNRWREQNQLLGVLVEHFTHQQDIASSISSVASTPAGSSGSTQPRRGRRPTPGPSAPSSKKPKRK